MRYFEKQSEEKKRFSFLDDFGNPKNNIFRRGMSVPSHNWIGHGSIIGAGGVAGALTGRLINNDSAAPSVVGGVLGAGIGGAVTYTQPKVPAAITRSITNLYRKVLGK